MAELVLCACPGCSEPGTSFCASCGLVKYCGRTCQTNDWCHHKEECQGRLRKIGEAHLEKARRVGGGRCDERDLSQLLHFSELALINLKKLNARPLDLVIILDDAMGYKYDALKFLDRKNEALECAKERYSLWAAGHMRNPGMLKAAFILIESLLQNNDFEQASLISSTAYEMIINDTDNVIPEDKRQRYLADGAYYLARATFRLAESGGIATEKKQRAGEETIALIRKALEIHTQLHEPESVSVAMDMSTLATVLQYFNGVDDDEVLRLHEQAIAIYSRVQGSLSSNVAITEMNLGAAYSMRAAKARAANNLVRWVADMKQAKDHSREAVRIFRAINHVDRANEAAQLVAKAEEELRQHIRSQIAVASAAIEG